MKIAMIIELAGLKNGKEASDNSYFSHSTINGWLRGENSPQISSVFLFARDLNVNIVTVIEAIEQEFNNF